MVLSRKQVEDVCLVYGGSKQCRYVDEDPDDYSKMYCKKLTPEKKLIDEEIDEYIKDCKNKGVDAYSQGVPLGNNCDGFILLKELEQGYDV